MSHDVRAVTVTLATSDAPPTSVPGSLTVFSPSRRMLRAGVVMLIFVGVAASLIPIPIVHLVGIPLALIVGMLVAFRTLRTVARLAQTHLACPKCGARNNVGGGLGYRTETGPVDRACESCRRPLELRFVPRET
ncbi:MAG TPA: hypothetical protein VFN22_00040 [Gemmatimonadales bacterium]|nr:hypothetical protein [Gemmatimonadales bacterium]